MYAQYLLVFVCLGAATAYPQAYYLPEEYVVFEVPENSFVEGPGELYRARRSLQPGAGQEFEYKKGVFTGNIENDDQGTKVSTGINRVFFEDKTSRLDGNVNWSKVINGPGRAKPVFSGGFNYRW